MLLEQEMHEPGEALHAGGDLVVLLTVEGLASDIVLESHVSAFDYIDYMSEFTVLMA